MRAADNRAKGLTGAEPAPIAAAASGAIGKATGTGASAAKAKLPPGVSQAAHDDAMRGGSPEASITPVPNRVKVQKLSDIKSLPVLAEQAKNVVTRPANSARLAGEYLREKLSKAPVRVEATIPPPEPIVDPMPPDPEEERKRKEAELRRQVLEQSRRGMAP